MAKKNNFENLRSLMLLLSAAEKRDFKKASSFWGAGEQVPRYIQLFDLLNDALRESPDMAAPDFMARKKVAAKFSRDQLGETSNTLYLNLLKNLRGHTHVGRTRREAQACLSNIHFLYHKRLFDAAMDWVERGKVLCDNHDLSNYKMELLFWERKMLFGSKLENFVERTNEIEQTEISTIAIIDLETKLQAMLSLLRSYPQSKKASPAEKINHEIQLLEQNHPLWQAQLAENRFGTRMLDHCMGHAMRILLASKNSPSTFLGKPLDHQMRLQHFAETIENMEKSNMVEDDPHVYYRSISDYIATCIQIGDLDRAAKVDKLLPDDAASPDFLEVTVYARLLLFFKTKNYAGGKKFLTGNKVGAILDRSEGKIAESRYLFICFYAALMGYKCNDFTLADQFFRRMDRAQERASVPALSVMARIVEVYMEVRRESHLKVSSTSFYPKIVGELRQKLEAGGHFHGFHKTLWESLHSLEKAERQTFSKVFLEKLHAAAAETAHPEMSLLLSEWFAELPF